VPRESQSKAEMGEDSYRGGLGETAGLTEIFWMTPEVTEIAAPFGGPPPHSQTLTGFS